MPHDSDRLTVLNDNQRAAIAAQLFVRFKDSEGEARDRILRLLHQLNYNVDKQYVLESTTWQHCLNSVSQLAW